VNQATNIGTNLLEGFMEDLSLVRIPPWWQSPWFLALAAALLALLAFVGRKWWLKRRARPVAAQPRPAIPGEAPELTALRRLAELRQRMAAMGSYDFCTECSLILRQYIGPRFNLSIIYQTTREFLEHAQTSPALGAAHRDSLGLYLQFADKVKFGRDEMSREEMGRMIDYAEGFVNSSAGGKQP
jgi:hypothetical protein